MRQELERTQQEEAQRVEDEAARKKQVSCRPAGNPGVNLGPISNRCHPILVVFVWELTKGIINLPLGCLQGGERIFIELVTSDRTLEASREASK